MAYKYLKQEADEIDEPEPGVREEEEDEVGSLGVGEARRQVGDHGDGTGFPGPDHDHHEQEEQDFCFSHVQLARFLRRKKCSTRYRTWICLKGQTNKNTGKIFHQTTSIRGTGTVGTVPVPMNDKDFYVKFKFR